MSRVKVSTESAPRLFCQHCKHEWSSRKGKNVRCPECKMHLNAPAEEVKVYRRPMGVKELRRERFTPDTMKELIARGMYAYKGIPEDMPTLSASRHWRRKAHIEIADYYLKTKYSMQDIAKASNITRAGVHFRIKIGVKMLAELGRFVITDKGKRTYAAARLRGVI